MESEALLKILFLNMASKEFGDEAAAMEELWRALAREYTDGGGLFPERVHVNTLFWVLLDRWARLRADWARWAAAEVESWPDEGRPGDPKAARVLLRRMLETYAPSPAEPSVMDDQSMGFSPRRSRSSVDRRAHCPSAFFRFHAIGPPYEVRVATAPLR